MKKCEQRRPKGSSFLAPSWSVNKSHDPNDLTLVWGYYGFVFTKAKPPLFQAHRKLELPSERKRKAFFFHRRRLLFCYVTDKEYFSENDSKIFAEKFYNGIFKSVQLSCQHVSFLYYILVSVLLFVRCVNHERDDEA